MTAQTILPANSVVSGGYDVDNSARFQTASLKRSAGSKTNATQATISMWFKRSDLVDQVLMQSYTDDNNRAYIKLLSNTFYFFDKSGGTNRNYWVSTFVLRDISAWYHLHINIDTGNGTAANRFIVHLNGVNQPVANFTNNASYGDGVTSNWQQATGSNQFTIGANESVNDQYFGGYMAETVYLDGQVVAYDSFGEFDEDSGIWKPIDGLADLTPGSTGFYLDFKDSSALGADVIGSNDFTAAGLAAVDQSTDTCTNNFATLNPLDVNPSSAGDVFTEGNLKLVTNNNSNAAGTRSTIAVSSGKWYAEVKYTSATAWNGVAAMDVNFHTDSMGAATISWYQGRTLYVDGTNTANWGSAVSAGDIVGIALDMDNNKVTISQGGQWWDTDAFDAAAPTTYQNLTSGYDTWGFMCRSGSAASTSEWNFGAPMFTGTDEADGDGFGSFEYAVPSGYFALCSKNLAEYG
jgi:hypothetical protein